MSVINTEIILESFIFNKKDIEYKVDNFKDGYTNKLLITGLSGSGKSTLGEKLAEECNAIYIELDLFEHNHILFEWKDKLPEGNKIIKQYFLNKYNGSKDFSNVSGEEFHEEFRVFLTYIFNDSRKMVIEGLQFVTQNDAINDLLQSRDYPMIIKGTSIITSMIRRYKRDDKNVYKLLFWYIKMDKSLNKNLRSKYR